MKTPEAKPYGIKVDAEGRSWAACNGSSCPVEVDPVTMALTAVELPIPGRETATCSWARSAPRL